MDTLRLEEGRIRDQHSVNYLPAAFFNSATWDSNSWTRLMLLSLSSATNVTCKYIHNNRELIRKKTYKNTIDPYIVQSQSCIVQVVCCSTRRYIPNRTWSNWIWIWSVGLFTDGWRCPCIIYDSLHIYLGQQLFRLVLPETAFFLDLFSVAISLRLQLGDGLQQLCQPKHAS